ncbi:MAG: hypothetical protein KDA44_23300 [Planctomycetales bacterium]|nr:hypothetical protein [Planctomycetales bacterium]
MPKPSSTSSSSAKRASRAQFSLMTLLLATTAICAVIGAAFTAHRLKRQLESQTQELYEAQLELQSLREELGVLSIGDKNRIHVLRRKFNDFLDRRQPELKFCAYLPPGRSYLFASQINNLPPLGQNQAPDWSRGGGLQTTRDWQVNELGQIGVVLAPGEYILSFAIVQTADGSWEVETCWDTLNSYSLPAEGAGRGLTLPPDNNRWPFNGAALDDYFTSGGAQFDASPTETVVLLNRRSSSDGALAENAEDGFMLWIEPLPSE